MTEQSIPVLMDEMIGEVRAIVRECPMCPCAYLGVKDKRDLSLAQVEDEVEPHGGFTFDTWDAPSGSDILPDDYFWVGWDYAHGGDLRRDGALHTSRWPAKRVIYEARIAAARLNNLLRSLKGGEA